MKQHFFAPMLLVIALFLPAQAFAEASEASKNASQMLSIGAGSLVVGSAGLLSAGGQFVVESVEKTVDGTAFVFSHLSKDLSKGGKISVRVSGNTAGATSIIAGQLVQVVAETAGMVIMAAGEIIAFIPNQVGQSLLHHSSVN